MTSSPTPRRFSLPWTSGELTSYLELPASVSAPRWARRHTRATLSAWLLWPETIETAELLVSELVTNAALAVGIEAGAKSARTNRAYEGKCVSVLLRCPPEQLVIEVTDPDPNLPRQVNASTDAESGRGLVLVDALSKEWGHTTHLCGTKTVYCVIPSAP